jgi:hypothetical protein
LRELGFNLFRLLFICAVGSSFQLRFQTELFFSSRMSARTTLTNITAIPADIAWDSVIDTLRSHAEMIDLNPLVIERSVLAT